MQLMQRNQEIGQTFSDAEVESENERQAFEHELEAIDARYAEALDRELAPIKAKFADLDRRALADPIRTEAGDFYREWAVKEWNALAAQENAAYEKIGAEWWAVSGPFHGWLERYREHLAKRVPPREEVENVGAGFMVQLVGTPSATFKPTASLRAADEFMNQAAQVLAKRRAGPLKPMESSEGGAPRR